MQDFLKLAIFRNKTYYIVYQSKFTYKKFF